MICGSWGTVQHKDRNRDTGIWTQTSYFNHVYQPDVSLEVFGDILFAYGKRKLRAEEELRINYLVQKLHFLGGTKESAQEELGD